MPHSLNSAKKPLISIRHSPEVKAFVDAEAAKNNDFPSAFSRKVFNAGLEAMFPIKIENNQIVQLPPTSR